MEAAREPCQRHFAVLRPLRCHLMADGAVRSTGAWLPGHDRAAGHRGPRGAP